VIYVDKGYHAMGMAVKTDLNEFNPL
jgi:hypothetical protein